MSNKLPYRNDPQEIKARFDSVCAETGKEIKRGDLCIYYPSSKKVYHPESKQGEEYRRWRADLTMGYDY